MGFALRFAQQTSGEVAVALTVQCFSRLHPSGLRERDVRSTIVDIKGDFTKKGVFTRPVKRKLSGEKRLHSPRGYVVMDGEEKRAGG